MKVSMVKYNDRGGAPQIVVDGEKKPNPGAVKPGQKPGTDSPGRMSVSYGPNVSGTTGITYQLAAGTSQQRRRTITDTDLPAPQSAPLGKSVPGANVKPGHAPERRHSDTGKEHGKVGEK